MNYYSDDELRIVLGAMPAPDEVTRYWLNWSKALTGGQWNPAAFFADATEARRLARFNQFVLAAHEYGHVLSYRYDPNHVERHDYAVNYREFYADRLSTAMVTEAAAADPNLAALQARYVELMASFNAKIPAPAHYDIASLDLLQADCASISVSQPTAETMAPYASAFFERQRLLLAAGPAPLAALYAAWLFPPLAERSPPGSGLAGGVETLRRTGGVWAVTEVAWVPEDLINAYVIRDPATGVYLVSMSIFGDHPGLFTLTAFDAETLAPEPAVVLDSSGQPLAIGPRGEYFFFEDHAVWVETRDDGRQRFAGNLLQGAKDREDPLAAEFFDPRSGLSTLDGGLLLFDPHPLQRDKFIIRGIAPAATVN